MNEYKQILILINGGYIMNIGLIIAGGVGQRMKMNVPKQFIKVLGKPIMIYTLEAFDKNKNRMGRGRGYYDKLLSSSKAFKIGVGFDFQVLDKVPTEEFDIPMNRIVAESNIY
jgi:5,10-methenyltetrahydrofolate synthetase